MPQALDRIIERQLRWAAISNLPLDEDGHAPFVSQNLFQPMNGGTRLEFEAGAGNEIAGDRPDMASARSSSALAVNVFDPWRAVDLTPLVLALGADPRCTRLRFEQPYPTGLRGTPPHLDVVLDDPSGGSCLPTAIECKFSEPYSAHKDAFRPSYFAQPRIWDGLEQLRNLASAIDDHRDDFKHLGVAQLIKHSIGLRRAYGSNGFRLMYLWYAETGLESERHAAEIETFAGIAQDEIQFVVLTYQELFERLGDSQPAVGYLDYLRLRYFA